MNINPRSGKIKTRIFALLLFVISCSLLISAYRSLGREFSGIVVKKTISPGVSFDQHWVYLLPDSEINTSSGSRAIISALTEDREIETDVALHRIGVSAVVYAEASKLNKIEKKPFSPMISVQSRTYIDLGINWFVYGIAGMLLSIWMYIQTLKSPPPAGKYESEEIDLPGF